jgi:hypothetical protein
MPKLQSPCPVCCHMALVAHMAAASRGLTAADCLLCGKGTGLGKGKGKGMSGVPATRPAPVVAAQPVYVAAQPTVCRVCAACGGWQKPRHRRRARSRSSWLNGCVWRQAGM